MAYEKLTTTLKQTLLVDDPANATTLRFIGWQSMVGECFVARCLLVSGTGVLIFKIWAGVGSAPAATNRTEVLAHAAPTDADAAGDMLVLETHAEEILQKLQAAGIDTLGGRIHVSVQMDNDASGDVNAIDYTFGDLHNPKKGATADVIA